MTTIHKLLVRPQVTCESVRRQIESDPQCIHFYAGTMSVLDQAVVTNRIDIVRLLIELGARLNAQDVFGVCSLHAAIQEQNMDMVELLIKSGADVHLKDEDGWSAIHFALSTENRTLIQFILEQGLHPSDRETNTDKDLLSFVGHYGEGIASWFEGVLMAYEERVELTKAAGGDKDKLRSDPSVSKSPVRL